jgi:hypothetical protein
MAASNDEAQSNDRRKTLALFDGKMLTALTPYVIAAVSAFYVHEHKIITLEFQVSEIQRDIDQYASQHREMVEAISQLKLTSELNREKLNDILERLKAKK